MTWIAHWLVSLVIALVGGFFFGKIGFLIGTTLAMGFYVHREYRDMRKYQRQGKWDDHNLSDGVGDLIGPAALWIGAILANIF